MKTRYAFYAILAFCFFLFLNLYAGETALRLINVIQPGEDSELPSLIPNDPERAVVNTLRMKTIMDNAQKGAAIYFPAGNYYFNGSALPNRGSIETSRPGQTIYGDGANLTRIFQVNLEKDFGFNADPSRKHVPCSTIRVRHKGATVRDLTVAVDPNAPENTIALCAAIQLAHIAYFPDGNIGIIETTGIGNDFLLDNVTIKDINIGIHHGSGIQAAHFFELGIDIIGSGGIIKVSRVGRLDAKFGIRLDNGNHCGQGNYYFDHIYMIGKHGVTNGGVFFDWIGGQLAVIRDCEATYTNAIHVGPLGATGDRLEPFVEAEVVRSPDRNWDWLTWHGHPVPAEPSKAQISEWFGLPRCAEVISIGSQPRTGGKEWKKGEHFKVERTEEPGSLENASRIIWLKEPPPRGFVYYVTFQLPEQYRVHDLEWGSVTDCFFGEALQTDENGYAFLFDDQGFVYSNPDFNFPVGYGLEISGNTILNGNLVFRGNTGYIKISDNTCGGVCDVLLMGKNKGRQLREISLNNNFLKNISLGDWVSLVRITQNRLEGSITMNAPLSAHNISLQGNIITSEVSHGVKLIGEGIRHVDISGNTVFCDSGAGIILDKVKKALVKDNNISGCSDAGIQITDGAEMIVGSNILSDNNTGICIKSGAAGKPVRLFENLLSENKSCGIRITAPKQEFAEHISIGENTFSGNGKDSIIETGNE